MPALSPPPLARSRAEIRQARAALSGPVAVVMTMGALHEGHVSLLRLARSHARHVVATVFVNPLQFGPGEDFDAYPRTWEADLDVLAREQVDLVVAPRAADLYPSGSPEVQVRAGALAQRLEGAERPGHFDGVLTVVTVLLHLTRPRVAVFGAKDYQQLVMVRRLVADLALDVEVVAGPTVREPDGLALSSRNRRLTPEQRELARALPRGLAAADEQAAAGAGAAEVRAAVELTLAAAGLVADYCALVDPASLTEVADGHRGAAVLLVAVRVGAVRLLDNRSLTLGPAG